VSPFATPSPPNGTRLNADGPLVADAALETEAMAPMRPDGYRRLNREAMAAGRRAGEAPPQHWRPCTYVLLVRDLGIKAPAEVL